MNEEIERIEIEIENMLIDKLVQGGNIRRSENRKRNLEHTFRKQISDQDRVIDTHQKKIEEIDTKIEELKLEKEELLNIKEED